MCAPVCLSLWPWAVCEVCTCICSCTVCIHVVLGVYVICAASMCSTCNMCEVHVCCIATCGHCGYYCVCKRHMHGLIIYTWDLFKCVYVCDSCVPCILQVWKCMYASCMCVLVCPESPLHYCQQLVSSACYYLLKVLLSSLLTCSFSNFCVQRQLIGQLTWL